MATPVLRLALRSQEDVLLTRRRARDLAALLQFTPAEQIGLSTAVWEVARLAEHQGEVELAVVEAPPSSASSPPQAPMRGSRGSTSWSSCSRR